MSQSIRQTNGCFRTTKRLLAYTRMYNIFCSIVTNKSYNKIYTKIKFYVVYPVESRSFLRDAKNVRARSANAIQ